MSRRRTNQPRRRGITLLEVITAVALSATMMASSFVVLRSTYAAWQAHEADLERAGNASAVLRHLVRCVRQSTDVSAITLSNDTSGSLTVVDQNGSTLTWDHLGTSVTLSTDAGVSQPLADDIEALSFEGYQADGVTLTTDPNEVQLVRAVVTTQLPAGGSRTISSSVWVRAW